MPFGSVIAAAAVIAGLLIIVGALVFGVERFRHREWTPAIRAAGLEHRRIYDCRHTFATWAIEDGVPLWQLATIMGTSVVQIEDTYARWLKRTNAELRAAFDAYDATATG